MASVRIEPSNRLHTAAARQDGLAEVKRLIEIEKLDVNQLHTEDGIPPIAFAAQSGSLEVVKYLLECKSSIVQPKGKQNLLLYAVEEKQDSDKIKFIAGLYKDFNDGTTELHAGVACKDLGRINDLIIIDSNAVYIRDDNDNTSIKYALKAKYFDIAGFLLIHADHTRVDFQESLEIFLEEISVPEFSPEDKAKHRNTILQIIAIVEPIKSARFQCIYYTLLLLADYFNLTQNKDEQYRLFREIQNLILGSKEPILSKELAWTFFNLALDLENKERLKSLFYEIALQLMPNTTVDSEHLFHYVASTLALNQDIQSIRTLSNRVQSILDAKDEINLKEAYDGNSQNWIDDVIYPLMKNPTREACESAITFLRLILRIAPDKTLENKIFIAKLRFIEVQNYLKLDRHEEASRVFRECKLETGQVLSDDAIDELITATAALAKIRNFDALMQARGLVAHEKFIERLKILILKGSFWKEVLSLLEAFHAKGLIEVFLPNTLIGDIPFIIHIAKSDQYEILRFWFEKTSIMSGTLLTSSVPVETGDTQNCTALYFVGVSGDFVAFRYLLERMPTLYHPEPTTAHTKPFIHALLENAGKDFSKFSHYYKILEIVVNKYPDEINRVWKGETTVYVLNRVHATVKVCLGPALRSRELKMQAELESQIRREILNNEIIKPLLSGGVTLSSLYFYKTRPEEGPVDGATILRENIEMLDSLINPYSGTGWLRVSESFYNTEFLPWKLKCDSDAGCYSDDGLPVVQASNSIQMIKEINTIINLAHNYFTRSMRTPLLKCHKSRDLICHRDAATSSAEDKNDELPLSGGKKVSIENCDVLTNKAELPGELKREIQSSTKYTPDTMHPASSSFLRMFKDKGEFKEERIDEKLIGPMIHPAYR